MASATDYVPFGLEGLQGGLPLFFDLYIKKGERYQLYRKESSSLLFTLEDCQRLLASGLTHLWIRIPTEEHFGIQRLVALLAMPDEHLSPRAKAHLWHGTAKATAQRAINNAASKGMLADIRGLMEATVGYLARNSSAFPALLSATLHEYSLHTHSVNVAMYALGLGKFVGVTAQEDLRDLGLAAFLHDVGKAKVGLEVLQKPGQLTSEEWAIMRQHPDWGMEALSQVDDLPQPVRAVVAQHHERLDGSGYPRGLAGEDIDFASRVVALADAFDAMTSVRSYKSAYSAYGALSLLKNDVEAGKLDPDLFVGLVLLLGGPSRIGHA